MSGEPDLLKLLLVAKQGDLSKTLLFRQSWLNSKKYFERRKRLELSTSSLARKRSTTELPPLIFEESALFGSANINFSGASFAYH